MIDRSLYYWSNLYSNGLYKKEDYKENKRTIVINILGFNIFKDGPYHERCMIRRDYNGEVLTEELEMHFIQIPKCKKEKIKTALDLWIRFIGDVEDKEVEKMEYEVNEETLNAVREAQEQYWRIMENPVTQRIAELREKAIRDEVSNINHARKEGKEAGIKEGRKEGRKEGKKEGQKEKTIEIAKNLMKEGMKIEFIEKVTGLTQKEIEKI